MSFTPGTTFQAQGVSDQNASSMSNATVIETYVTTVTVQPTFGTLPDVPDLQTHQTTSKTTAQSWINSVRINLYQNNTDLLAFGTKFNTFYDNLVTLAKTINDPASRTDFALGVQLLLNDVDAKATNAQNTVNALSAWNGLLGTDSSNFQGDLTKVQAVYEGDKGILAGLKTEIQSDTDAMSKDLSLIAGGAAMDVVGGLIIACGLLLEIPSGGTSTAVVATGIAFEVGGSTMIGVAAKDYTDKMNDKATATQKLANLTAEIALAHSLGDTLTALGSKCSDALTVANQMLKTWQTLQTNFQTTHNQISDLSVDIPEQWLLAELQTSKADWDAVIATATVIQQQLEGIPVQNNTKVGLGSASTQSARPAATNRLLKSLVPVGVRHILLNAESTGDIVRLLIDSIKLIKVDIAGLNTAMKSDLGTSAAAAGRSASILIKTLEELGSNLSRQLSTIVQKTPVNSLEVTSLFELTLGKLAEVKRTITALAEGAAALGQQTATTVATRAAAVDALAATAHNERIQTLTKEIKDLSFRLGSASIASVGSVVVPGLPTTVNSGVASIYSKDSALRAARASAAAKTPIAAEFRRLEALERLAKSLSDVVASYTNHIFQLDTAFQALYLSFKSVVLPGVTDDLMRLWVQAQAQDLIDSLNGLEGISKPAAPGSLHRLSAFPIAAAPVTKGLGDTPLPSTMDTLSAISAATVSITGAAAILAKQPNIQLNDVDQFAEQFQLARDHAKQFQASFVSDLLAPLGQASSLGTFIVQVLQTITSLVNSGNFADAITGVQYIQSHLQDTIALNQVSRQNLAVFLQAVLDDQSRFVVLEATVPQALSQGIAKLTQDAKDLQDQIEADNQKIAQGATQTVLKVLGLEAAIAIAIGLSFVGFPVAEGAGELTVFAIKSVNAGIKAAAGAAKDKAEATLLDQIGGNDALEQVSQHIDKLRSTITELVREQASLAVFNTADAQVRQIASAVANGVAQIDTLNKGTIATLMQK
eukprot:Phypoly_transcript_01396.p1 GENE.Phypoly_transcript_01396~~Phypoly_transcript_01396.p1  ORF type:complete len:992 (+),score=181.63 Phypoly_transcript_01396:44-3019(+)